MYHWTFNRTLKFRSESEEKPLNQIYNEELSNLSKTTSISNEAFAKNDKFQSFQQCKSIMQKRIGTRRRRFPKSLKDIFLTKDQKETTKGEKFLLYQKKKGRQSDQKFYQNF